MHKNNFDFLRLLFAIFVVVTHSYPLSGLKQCDILCQVSGGRIYFSYLGVTGFFIISGYLVFQSLLRSRNILDYYRKRALRLFPALFVVLLLTVLLAPVVYNSSLPYLENPSVYTYLPRNLSLFNLQHPITGVFETLPYKRIINGSLWTIPYEFLFYILLSLLILTRNNVKLIRVLLLACFVILLTGRLFYFTEAGHYVLFSYNAKHIINFGLYFLAGSLLAIFRVEDIRNKKTVLPVALVLTVAAVYFNVFSLLQYFTIPFVVVLFGKMSTRYINNISGSVGDLSYGIYLYSFPVQQTLMYYFAFNYFELVTTSLLISVLLAFFSWHVIEKNTLKLKKLRLSR